MNGNIEKNNVTGQIGVNADAGNNSESQVVKPGTNLSTGHASIYVGDLHADTTENQLYEKFGSIGMIVSIKICRDFISRKSLRYAYVNYYNHADAERAIEQLNFDEIMGRQIRIMWCQRDPSLRKSGQGNVFIKNLEKNIDSKSLFDTFSAFGQILSCKISTDENGESKGYGFVHFKLPENAEKAIAGLNGMEISGKKVSVCKFVPRQERAEKGIGKARYNNVYVKNFGEDIGDDEFKALFEQYGELGSIKLEKSAEGKPKGFGFVCFVDFEAAEKAVNAINDLNFKGRKLFCGRALKKTERQAQVKALFEQKRSEKSKSFVTGVNLYVKNLDDSINDEKLRDAFKGFGKITSAKVMLDSSGRSKGFGFVCFELREQAAMAVTEMSGKLIGSKPLYVALAQRKEERKQQLVNQYQGKGGLVRPNQMSGFGGGPNPQFPGMNQPPQPMFGGHGPGHQGSNVPSMFPGNMYQPFGAVRGPVFPQQTGGFGIHGPSIQNPVGAFQTGGAQPPRQRWSNQGNMIRGQNPGGGNFSSNQIPGNQAFMSNAGLPSANVPGTNIRQGAPVYRMGSQVSVGSNPGLMNRANMPVPPNNNLNSMQPVPGTRQVRPTPQGVTFQQNTRNIPQQQFQNQPIRQPPPKMEIGNELPTKDSFDDWAKKVKSLGDANKEKQHVGDVLYKFLEHTGASDAGNIIGVIIGSFNTDDSLKIVKNHLDNPKDSDFLKVVEKTRQQLIERARGGAGDEATK